MDTLKKFTIVFGADTRGFDNGIKKTESSLKRFGKVFNSIAATYFSYKMFQGVVNGFVDFNNKIRESSDLMGYSSENLSALGGALKRFGGDTDSTISSLDSLSSKIHEAKMGGGALVEVAKRYGISFTNSNGQILKAESLLMSLGNQMSRYDRQTRVAIASQLGLDKSIVMAFASGGHELQKLMQQQKRFGVVTQKDMKISKNFSRAMLDLRDSFQGVIRILARLLLPSLTKLAKLVTNFIEFMKKHKAFVVAFFGALLIAMLPVLAVFVKMAVASAAAFAPVYAVVAVITAIALVIEDIYYYFMGWDSVTGDLAKKFPLLGKILESIRPIVNNIIAAFKWLIDFIQDPSWDKFVDRFNKVAAIIKESLLKGLESVKGLLSKIMDSFANFINKIGGFFGFGSDDTPAAPPPVVSGNTSTQTNNIINNVTQNISSATPKQLADSVNTISVQSINSQRQQRGGY